MSPLTYRCWLNIGPVRLPIPSSGLLIGRQADCAVVLSVDSVSGWHAWLHATPEGPELLHFGLNPTRVNGKAVPRAVLGDGDVVSIEGHEFPITVTSSVSCPERTIWTLERQGQRRVPLGRFPFMLGGGPDDDLRIPGCPPKAASFSLFEQQELRIQWNAQARHNDEPVPPGVTRLVESGDWIELGDVLFVVRAISALDLLSLNDTLPSQRLIRLQVRFLSEGRGGLLYFVYEEDRKVLVRLSERLYTLAMVLLQPREGGPGDWVSCDEILSRVWPRNPDRTSANINLLICRLRQSLCQAGLSGIELIERQQLGTDTRFAIPANTEVTLE